MGGGSLVAGCRVMGRGGGGGGGVGWQLELKEGKSGNLYVRASHTFEPVSNFYWPENAGRLFDWRSTLAWQWKPHQGSKSRTCCELWDPGWNWRGISVTIDWRIRQNRVIIGDVPGMTFTGMNVTIWSVLAFLSLWYYTLDRYPVVVSSSRATYFFDRSRCCCRCWYCYSFLVYTTQVNTAFRAIWLVPLSRDIKYYSPPGGFRRKKMSRETHFSRK